MRSISPNRYLTSTVRSIGDIMGLSVSRAFICLILVAAVSIPALGMSNGPGAYNSNDELTVSTVAPAITTAHHQREQL